MPSPGTAGTTTASRSAPAPTRSASRPPASTVRIRSSARKSPSPTGHSPRNSRAMSRSSPPRSSIVERARAADAAAGRHAEHARSLQRRIAIRTAAVMRWLHIYLSMFGLAAVLFFSVTGLTLNHPDWFGEPERRVSAQGHMAPEWLNPGVPAGSPAGEADESQQVAKLEIVEYLRTTHGVRGTVAEFQVDEQECTVTFKGP